MKKTAKYLFGLLTPVVLCFSCARVAPIVTTISKKDNDAFGNLGFAMLPKDFKDQGYTFGDMVNVKLKGAAKDGGDIIHNVAMVTNYNEVGYFAPCLCDYEGGGKSLAYSYGIDSVNRDVDADQVVGNQAIFDISDKMGYQDVRDLVEVSRKATYEETGKDAMVFANFRDVSTTIGGMSTYVYPGILFRGSSPFNYHNNPERCDYVNQLLKDYNIDYEVSLGNTKEKIDEYMTKASGKTKQLYDSKNNVFCNVQLASDYFTKEVNTLGGELRDGNAAFKVFKFISDNCFRNPTPDPENEDETYHAKFYIHCDEGKDRTGFICMVLEALAGVPIDLLVSDFMLTFRNYYNITCRTPEEKKKYDKLAELTIYRFIYSLLLANECEKSDDIAIKLAKIDWYNSDAKQMVEEKVESLKKRINGESFVMMSSATKYLELLNNDNDEQINIGDLQKWVGPKFFN